MLNNILSLKKEDLYLIFGAYLIESFLMWILSGILFIIFWEKNISSTTQNIIVLIILLIPTITPVILTRDENRIVLIISGILTAISFYFSIFAKLASLTYF